MIRAWLRKRKAAKARKRKDSGVDADWGLLHGRGGFLGMSGGGLCESREQLAVAIGDLQGMLQWRTKERNEYMEKYYDLLNEVRAVVAGKL